MIRHNEILVGLSPCPNDTFIFHALFHDLIQLNYLSRQNLKMHMADVEKLNLLTRTGSLPISKVSLGVLPFIYDQYSIFSSGAALGWGCGPVVIAKKSLSSKEIRDATIAIPGRMTTASLLLDLHGSFQGPRKEMIFNEIMPAVLAGKADIGVIIHEGRFVYQDLGLTKILDLGQWWEEKFKLPLPLGCIAGRRDLPERILDEMEAAIADSLRHAWRHPEDSREFIRANAQELDDEVTKAHIDTFVTNYSEDLGEAGKEAIEVLIKSAVKLRGGSMNKNLFLA